MNQIPASHERPSFCLKIHWLLATLNLLVMYQNALDAKRVLSHLDKLLQLSNQTERTIAYWTLYPDFEENVQFITALRLAEKEQ
jgi:hypothetical protein